MRKVAPEMNYIRIVLAMALTVGSAGVALAAGGGGNGGATPPNVTVPAAVGSANAEPPSYIVSGTTPTGSSTSSNHWAGQGTGGDEAEWPAHRAAAS